MLHFTNGDHAAAAIRALGIGGEVVPWRDVLHEGPVPAGLPLAELSAVRARFVAARGGGGEDEVARGFRERDAALAASADEDEVVLWFEHDLYDQLQLLQLLDWFAVDVRRPARLTLVGPADYLGPARPDRLARWFAERNEVSDAQLDLARSAWAAFRASDPRAVEHVVAGDTTPLPFLAAALRRQLEEFPGVRDGLSRSERQALAALADGPLPVRDAYLRSHHEQESSVWLGDTTFVSYLADLALPPHPLVAWEDGVDVSPMERRVALTDAGRDVLAGRADRVRLNGVERWRGGVHLAPSRPVWRWDAEAGRLVADDAR